MFSSVVIFLNFLKKSPNAVSWENNQNLYDHLKRMVDFGIVKEIRFYDHESDDEFKDAPGIAGHADINTGIVYMNAEFNPNLNPKKGGNSFLSYHKEVISYIEMSSILFHEIQHLIVGGHTCDSCLELGNTQMCAAGDNAITYNLYYTLSEKYSLNSGFQFFSPYVISFLIENSFEKMDQKERFLSNYESAVINELINFGCSINFCNVECNNIINNFQSHSKLEVFENN